MAIQTWPLSRHGTHGEIIAIQLIDMTTGLVVETIEGGDSRAALKAYARQDELNGAPVDPFIAAELAR